MSADDTIFALASGTGRAGIAVIRISGPCGGAALAALTGRTAWVPRRAMRVCLRDPQGEHLDDALALWFPAPASFTGENVAELHIHGGRAVIAAVMAALSRIAGLRSAEPGEFTRRAFLNGKLDLTQVEGLADLVAAETSAQHRQALRQLEGALGSLYEGWRRRLVAAMAHLEASMDFADEDLPEGVEQQCREEVAALRAEVAGHLALGSRGERIREGFLVVLIGPPNAGKSSLLNRLAGREAAIVDAVPGTTRDVVEVAMDIGGLAVLVADTAGLRSGRGRVEQEGVRRARQRAAEADLCIAVLDGAIWPAVDGDLLKLIDGDALILVNKSDLGGFDEPLVVAGRAATAVSAKTGEGIAGVVAEIGARLGRRFAAGDAVATTRLRHRHGVEACGSALSRAEAATAAEVMAEELRAAAAALGRIVGRVDVEEVLAAVFSEFCIGK